MKTVVITGIGKGIGKALAQKFLKEGWFVAGTFLNTSPEYSNENLISFSLDLANSESIRECAEQLTALKKPIDILINNAGALIDEDDKNVIPEKLRRTLEVNVIGTADFTERIIPLISSGGHIVNISSTAGSLARVGHAGSHYPGHYPAYKISKAALNMYTRTLALRLKQEGKTVSSVHPGWVRTDMGGQEAELTPEEAAQDIFDLAISRPESGGFWFKGERLPW